MNTKQENLPSIVKDTKTESHSNHVGKEIEKIAYQYGGSALMNADNKDMLDKIKDAKTQTQVVNTLMTDPSSGRTMSYAESRMRFG